MYYYEETYEPFEPVRGFRSGDLYLEISFILSIKIVLWKAMPRYSVKWFSFFRSVAAAFRVIERESVNMGLEVNAFQTKKQNLWQQSNKNEVSMKIKLKIFCFYDLFSATKLLYNSRILPILLYGAE